MRRARADFFTYWRVGLPGGATATFDLGSFQSAIGNNYAIGREIGRGGMATVFVAEDRKHDRQVAIKILNTEAGARSQERFQREIRLLARLQHPNILPVFDSGSADGRLWYAMPLVEGESLRARLDRENILGIDYTVSTLATLADALSYAHACGVVHRDIKPENILLSHTIPLIADFGIAAALDATAGMKLTETGMAIGTPHYMSPEQATGDPDIDGRSDIYSLGCVGFEMLAGKPPFNGANARAVVAQVLSGPAPSIRATRPDVSPSLESTISRAIAREPEERWQNGSEFSAALAASRDRQSLSVRDKVFTSPRSIVAAVAVSAAVIAVMMFSASGPNGREVAKSRRPLDSLAVSALNRGNARVAQRTQRTLIEGLALIDEALRRDSTFALAWAGRANAFNWARNWEFDVPGVPRDSLLAIALEASERAVDLDTLDATVWLTSATILGAVDPTRRDLPLRALRRAISLDSTNARAWIQLGITLQDRGEMDSALTAMRHGIVLGRRAVGAPSYANHFYWRRQYDSAAIWSDTAIKYSPTLPYSWETAGATALVLRKYETAKTYYDAAVRLDQGPTRVRGLEGLSEIAAIHGDKAKARALMAEAEKLTDRSAPSEHAAISLGSAYAALGDHERALTWLEKYQPRESLHFQLHLKRDPQLDPLRAEPRFAALLSK